MLNKFKNYLDEKKKINAEYKERYNEYIIIYETFINLLEEHKHYKIINKRVTDKFKCKINDLDVRVSIEKNYLKQIVFGYWRKGGYETEKLTFYDIETPECLLEKLREQLGRYREWAASEPDWKAQEEFYEQVSKLANTDTKRDWLFRDWARGY